MKFTILYGHKMVMQPKVVDLVTTSGKFSVLLIFLFFSCKDTGLQSKDTDQKESEVQPVDFDYEKIKERGSLKVLIGNSTTGYFIYRGQPMGFDYELMENFASSLNLKLELVMIESIEEAILKLNSGEGDIIAFNFTVTKERKKKVAFANHHILVRQVLVQRKPDNWRNMRLHAIEKSLIRNQIELIGKEVHVRKSSSYVPRLKNLSDEIGGDIIIIEDYASVRSEELIKQVSEGEIDYTVADENVAMVNSTYYPNLDVATPVSFSQRIAWAVRKNAPDLLDQVNQWLAKIKRKPYFNIVYNKYFRSPKSYLSRVQSDFFVSTSGKISEYDTLFKSAAETLKWDWRLIASQAYQESRFDPTTKSWAGAVGLMQLLPTTAKSYGIINVLDPKKNVKAATEHLIWLKNYWKDKIPNEHERLKFILASYNAGHGHVADARRLAEKYGRDPNIWDDSVEYFLALKSKPKFYNDPVSKMGYCRGEEPVNYVKEILYRYEQYRQLTETKEEDIEGDTLSA